MKHLGFIFLAALVAAVILSFYAYRVESGNIVESGGEELKETLSELEIALSESLYDIKQLIESSTQSVIFDNENDIRRWMQTILDKTGASDIYCILPDGEKVYVYELPFALPSIDERMENWYQNVITKESGGLLVFGWKDVRGEYAVEIAFAVGDLVFRISEYPLERFSSLLKREGFRLTLAAMTDKVGRKGLALASNVYKTGTLLEFSQAISLRLEDVSFLDGEPVLVGELDPLWMEEKRTQIRTFWTNVGLGAILVILALWLLFFFRKYKLVLQSPLALSTRQQILASIIAVIVSLGALSALVFILGRSPINALREMFSWAFLTRTGIIETLTRSVPVTLIAAGLCVAFEAGMWNIGGEGQFIIGAIATTGFSVFLFREWPAPFVLILTFLIASLAGALWALGPAVMKVKLGVSEILSTLMLNYVALKLLDYLVYGPWKSAEVKNFPLTDPVPVTLGKIPILNVHWGVLSIPIVAVFVWFLMRASIFGFEWKATGLGFEAARQAGIPVDKSQVFSLLLSGAVAGLAGAVHMFGAQYVLQHGFSPGYGYTAIIVAFISNLNPLAVLLTGPLITGLFVGNARLELTMNFPVSVSYLVQGIILVSLILVRNVFLYNPRIVKRGVN
ncbi:MAG: ral nucleoside transport system permease protein [Thermotogota bacterium]|nr:ral nucleoside transport system permease protein [Thermotogota bacterium]